MVTKPHLFCILMIYALLLSGCLSSKSSSTQIIDHEPPLTTENAHTKTTVNASIEQSTYHEQFLNYSTAKTLQDVFPSSSLFSIKDIGGYVWTIDSNGTMVLAKTIESNNDRQTTLYLRNLYTHSEEQFALIPKGYYENEFSINEGWVIWIETENDIMTATSANVMAYNRNTQQVSIVYSIPPNSDGTFPGIVPSPKLSGNKILFDQYETSELHNTINTIECDLLLGTNRIVASQFGAPNWCGSGYIGLIEDKTISGNSFIAYADEYGITQLNPHSFAILSISTFNKDALVLVQDSDSDAYKPILLLFHNGEFRLMNNPSDSEALDCGWPILTKNYGMWAFQSDTDMMRYVYDSANDCVYKVQQKADNLAFGFGLTDSFIYWSTFSSLDSGNLDYDTVNYHFVKLSK